MLQSRDIDRRAFLRGSAAALLTLAAPGCRHDDAEPAALPSGPPIVVDVHCHVFNARDLPVEGFARDVLIKGLPGPRRLLARALAFGLEWHTPDFDEEDRHLDRVLRGEVPAAVSAPRDPQQDLEQFLEEIRRERPELLPELSLVAEVEAGRALALPSDEAASLFLDTSLDRVIRWARLLTLFRVEIADALFSAYPDIALFTPSIVDLDLWVHDEARTSVADQILLYEKIVRWARGRLHPMVAYDPLRQVRRGGSLRTAQQAVTRGFVGVKLYPPMGFAAHGNAELSFPPDLDLDGRLGAELDEALDELFTWCEREGVAVLAHCNDSNEAAPQFGRRADPAFWARALAQHKDLRLCLGHLGGVADLLERGPESRAWAIGRLMSEREHVYADVGYHEVVLHTDGEVKPYIAAVRSLLREFPVARERLLYGSDWQMILLEKGQGDYSTRFARVYEDAVGDDAARVFRGENALDFLGLGPTPGGNHARLAAFYQKHALPLPSWWRPSPGDPLG